MMSAPRWSELTAIFGGAFDPPHAGHVTLVDGLFRDPGVARVWVVPTAAPAYKIATTAAEHRLAMARAAFAAGARANHGPIEVLSLELDRAARTGGATYSFDTLQELRTRVPDVGGVPKLAFVLGADQFREFHRWHRYRELLGLCHWIVLERKPSGAQDAQQVLRDWIASGLTSSQQSQIGDPRVTRLAGDRTFLIRVETPAPALASHDIRAELARLGQVDPLVVPPAVISYLKQHHLYGT